MRKIAFFTELPFEGKVGENFVNMRTEFAWMNALDADHISISNLKQPAQLNRQYDLGVLILPKNISSFVNIDLIHHARKYCQKVAFMQEGPSNYFQSLPLDHCFWFFSIMQSCDFCLAHNDVDRIYYEGLLNIDCYINPTLIIDSPISDLPKLSPSERSNIILGGNLGNWYGGFNSFVVASSALLLPAFKNLEIWAPSMGRMSKEELLVSNLNHLPYSDWSTWMHSLNNFKYAIHLNPNNIGGTFSLNCAYLGIPCIGSEDTNTQRICFPDLSIRPTDLKKANSLLLQLLHDENFYKEQSSKAIELYNSHFSKQVFLLTWEGILKNVFN